MKYIFFTIIFIILTSQILFSQVTGGDENDFPKDSVIIFQPSSPLKTYKEISGELSSFIGLTFGLTTSGFNIGIFWSKMLSDELQFNSRFLIGGARNSDELEFYDFETNRFIIRNKVNRLFSLPLTFGIKYFPFLDDIDDNFRPFIEAGGGFSTIIAIPYVPNNLFGKIPDAKVFVRPAMCISIGSEFGNKYTSNYSFYIDYYYVPFGGDGLESVDAALTNVDPVKNFGGVNIRLSIGTNW